MTIATYQYLAGILHLILDHGTSVELLDTQLKVVSQDLQKLELGDLADRVYNLRFAEEMNPNKLRFEVRCLLASIKRHINN